VAVLAAALALTALVLQREHHARLLLGAELLALLCAGRHARYPALRLLAAGATGFALGGSVLDDERPLGVVADSRTHERDLSR
jgi:hypothetical protein